MKKYLLALCMTMFAFVSSWAQSDWGIEVSTAPVYVEADGTGTRDFKITTPDNPGSFTIEAVEYVPQGGTAKNFASASTPVLKGGTTNEYTVTFSPYSSGSIGISQFYIVIKQNGSEVTSTKATPFEVNVYDKDLARSIVNPSTGGVLNIDKGATLNIPIVTPSTATLTVDTDPTTSDISVTKDSNGNLIINATNANVDDQVIVTLTPADGSKDRDGNTVSPVTFTVKVVPTEIPVNSYTMLYELPVGMEYDCPITPTTGTLGTDYTASYTVEPVANNVGVISLDGTTGKLTTLKVGLARATATFTPTTTGSLKDYRAWSHSFDFMVMPAQFSLGSFTVTEGTVADGPNAGKKTYTPTDTPEASVTPSVYPLPGYAIRYSLEGAIPNAVEVDPVTGVVTILDGEPKQTFQLVATLIPHDATNYVGASSKCKIDIDGTYSGAYLMRLPGDKNEWVAYLASPDQTGKNIVAEFEVKGGTLEQFKASKNIRVMGSINSFNIAQLVHAMGSDNQTAYSGTPKTLDMSGCTMNGPFELSHTNAGASDPVQTFSYPITGVAVGSDNSRVGQHLSLRNVGTFVFPRPDTSDPAYTVLPADIYKFFGNQYTPSHNSLTSLTITEGWTEIAANFSGKSQGVSAFEHLTDLKLPNSLERIGKDAFADLKVKVLTMPYNIHRIDKGAFSTSQNLQDVYFTGPAPEFVHTQAFAGVTQMCNNTVKDQQLQGKVNPEITRYEYYNGNNPRVLACLLHFPEQYRGQYTDVTREYKMLPAGEAYSKGYKLYTPDGWTSTFIEQVQRKKIDWNAYVSNKVDYGVKDAYYGLDMIWPSQNQMSTGFAIAQAGYQWSGQPLRTADQYNPSATYAPSATDEHGTLVDRRGLYQFIIAMGNADIDITFENDKWYTIALPFNMKVEEIKKVFGNDTQVCRFSKVTRITEGEHKQIKLEFRKSVMGDQTGDYDGTDFTDDYEHPHTSGSDDDHDGDYYGTGKTGIIHHFPYMIKPSGTVKNEYITQDAQGKWHFKGLDFERISGTLHPDIRRPEGFQKAAYTFTPILSTTKIKKNSYALVNKGNKHQFAFYKGTQKDGVYVDGGTANQNTAYVQLPITAETSGGSVVETDWGQLDYDTFFKKSSTGAKVYTFYADDYDDAPTAVEEVVIECGQDQVDNGKIYSINGQLVSGRHLPAGIYIKNGKKILVK